jgi:hypothetical protein
MNDKQALALAKAVYATAQVVGALLQNEQCEGSDRLPKQAFKELFDNLGESVSPMVAAFGGEDVLDS